MPRAGNYICIYPSAFRIEVVLNSMETDLVVAPTSRFAGVREAVIVLALKPVIVPEGFEYIEAPARKTLISTPTILVAEKGFLKLDIPRFRKNGAEVTARVMLALFAAKVQAVRE